MIHEQVYQKLFSQPVAIVHKQHMLLPPIYHVKYVRVCHRQYLQCKLHEPICCRSTGSRLGVPNTRYFPWYVACWLSSQPSHRDNGWSCQINGAQWRIRRTRRGPTPSTIDLFLKFCEQHKICSNHSSQFSKLSIPAFSTNGACPLALIKTSAVLHTATRDVSHCCYSMLMRPPVPPHGKIDIPPHRC
jgi:hypothetical protein